MATRWYSTAIHRGIARFARQANWILDVSIARSGYIPENWRGSGVLCNLAMDKMFDRRLETVNIPVVNIGNKDHPKIFRVASDNMAVGRMAADYFIQRGFHYFAFFAHSNSQGEQIRMTGFAEQVKKQRRQFFHIDWTPASLHLCRRNPDDLLIPWLSKQLTCLPKPLAVFVEFDDRAIDVINACLNASIPVPEQVVVLGVGNDELHCEFAPVSLSSIDDDQELIGYKAAELLDRLIQGYPVSPKPVLVAPKGIITRCSTDIMAISHPLVAMALKIIWQHYTEPIGAKFVASFVPMSSRRLHDAFMEHIGHSIADEITRKRLEHARKLLLETTMKTVEIATLSGFTDYELMGKTFRRVLGVTPTSYRKRFNASANDTQSSK